MIASTISCMDLQGKKVFLRADLNVPLSNGTILDDYRLRSVIPTIDLLQEKGATIILATHLGRPSQPNESLSTRHLIPWFEQRGYSVTFHENVKSPIKIACRTIILLENLRFYPEEKNGDTKFAKTLAHHADYYVNDAFGALHRADTSLVALAYEFRPEHRSIGLLIEKEMRELSYLRESPKHPFVFIIGGGKIVDKLTAAVHLLPIIDVLLIGPAIAFTFLEALKLPYGKSLVDQQAIELSKLIINAAQKNRIKLILPDDYYMSYDAFEKTMDPIPVIAENFPANGVGITIGPRTVDKFSAEISKGGTIFYSGLMGDIKRPETLESVKKIFKAMAESSGKTVIGGGDSVAAITHFHLENSIDFLSTGGGATLHFLAGDQLPGLTPFI